jgi:eukaryotic-like serine/threonine-protein kinase
MTALSIRCPRGHSWDPAEFDDDPAPVDSPVACPYCGALCTPTVQSLGVTPPVFLSTDDTDVRPTIPGYQVLDVLGRGGMGVVYKARQVRTDRVVALKVPGHLDLETRVRFTTEAQAAARVSHPHIVQVYEVGEHQGRPFLALEYVDGGTLSERLTGNPLPPRAAAALTETVARAVGAAHAHGVIHRDLKPANILLDRAEFGTRNTVVASRSGIHDPTAEFRPKVADFGLARRIDAETRHTLSGVILGTPEYMSPEQAAGDAHKVGPPADVWALGAILYELLTGRSPFRGTGMIDTLDQVRGHDPVPPRQLQPAVPWDLETICLKCLHKEADRRYPNADELADDLRRFLDGLPVRARPVSRIERWVKRAKRNPLATGLAAGLWLVVIAAIGYGVWYHFRLQEQRDRAQTQRDRARYHFQMSVNSIEGLLVEVAEEDLAREPRAELKRKALLEKARAFCDKLREVEPDAPELAWLAAHGSRLVGDINRLLDRYPEALSAYEQALEGLAALVDHPPEGKDPTREIADCHNFIGEVYRLKGTPVPAAEAYRRALAIQQPLHEADPEDAGYRQDLSRTHYNLGLIARKMDRPAVAVAELTEAGRLLDERPTNDVAQRRHRARVHLNLGAALWALDLNRLPEAEQECRAAIALYDALIAETRGQPDFRYEQQVAVNTLGLILWSNKDRTGARKALTGARDVLDRLSNDFPWTPQYRAELARSFNGLAVVAFADRAAARVVFDALAAVACQVRSTDEAAVLSGKAADTWAKLVADRGTPEYHGELGIALSNQGRALEKLRPDEARALLNRGLTELLLGLSASPDDRKFRDALRLQNRVFAGLLVQAGDHAGVRELANRLANEPPDRVLGTHRAVAMLAACVTAVERDRRPAAEADGYEAMAVKLVAAVGPTDWSGIRADPDCIPLINRSAAFAKAVGK